MEQAAFKILTIGLESEVVDFLKSRIPTAQLIEVRTAEDWENGVADFSDATQDLVVCGPKSVGVPAIEVAQALRSMCPCTQLSYAAVSTADLTVKSLNKNGFQHVFLLPDDRFLFSEVLARLENSKTGGTRKLYRGVTLVDVSPGDPLDFNVSIFLPINNKYVKVIKGGDALDQKKYDRFQNFQVSKVFVDTTEMDKFYKYSAEKLKALNNPSQKMSETERQERLTSSIRMIVLNLFDTTEETSFDQGKELMADTQKIVSEMIGLECALDIHKQLGDALQQPGESSTRANRVSTFAALFEMIVGLKKTQMAAIAGLFLDIGLSTLSREIVSKPYSEMTPDERAQYESHPAASLRLMQSKKMVVPPDVQNAIMNHHERLDGSGYPAKLPGSKISPLAQIVALADRFDELTFQDGKREPVDLAVVFDRLSKENICGFEMMDKVRSAVLKVKKAA